MTAPLCPGAGGPFDRERGKRMVGAAVHFYEGWCPVCGRQERLEGGVLAPHPAKAPPTDAHRARARDCALTIAQAVLSPHASPQMHEWFCGLATDAIADALAATVADMKEHTYCAFCGQQFDLDGTGAAIKEHVYRCEAHPLKRELDAAVEHATRLIDERNALRATVERQPAGPPRRDREAAS